MSVSPRPDGFHSVTPFIMLDDVQAVIDFLKEAFGAETGTCLKTEKGEMWHCQVKVGDSMLMFADTMGEMKAMPVCLYLYVDDPDAAYERALKAGAKSIMPVADQFYGDRAGGVQDKAGNMWWVARQVEKLSQAELEKRARAEEAKRRTAGGKAGGEAAA